MAAASPARASSPSSQVSTHSMERRGAPAAGGSAPKCTSGPAYTEKQMTRPWQQGECELRAGAGQGVKRWVQVQRSCGRGA